MQNQDALKMKLNVYNHQSVKMPSIERFAEDKTKLKKFIMQVKIQINNEGPKLPIFMEKITYTKMYLTGKPLKWF